jgi:hypothetical protein
MAHHNLIGNSNASESHQRLLHSIDPAMFKDSTKELAFTNSTTGCKPRARRSQ